MLLSECARAWVPGPRRQRCQVRGGQPESAESVRNARGIRAAFCPCSQSRGMGGGSPAAELRRRRQAAEGGGRRRRGSRRQQQGDGEVGDRGGAAVEDDQRLAGVEVACPREEVGEGGGPRNAGI